MNKKIVFVILLMGLSVCEVAAQHYQKWVWFKRKQYISFGASINAMNYFGDITPSQSFTSLDIRYTKPSISIFVQKRLKPHFSARLMFTYGRIEGDDATADPKDINNQFRFARNLHFRNDIFELSASGILDLVGNRGVFYQRPSKVIPYLTFGIAAFYHNPQAIAPDKDQLGNSTKAGGEWVDLQPLGTEGQGRGKDGAFATPYSRIQVAFPLGVGLRYKISSRIDIGLEIAYRFTFTDYLDDVSGMYTDLAVFGDDNLARAMHDRSKEGGLARLAGARDEGTLTRPNEWYTAGNAARRAAYLDGLGITNSYNTAYFPTYYSFGNPAHGDTNRGNKTDNDVYITTAFTLTYIMPGQVRCPEPFKKRFRRHRL
jgi:hypothetical protein